MYIMNVNVTYNKNIINKIVNKNVMCVYSYDFKDFIRCCSDNEIPPFSPNFNVTSKELKYAILLILKFILNLYTFLKINIFYVYFIIFNLCKEFKHIRILISFKLLNCLLSFYTELLVFFHFLEIHSKSQIFEFMPIDVD